MVRITSRIGASDRMVSVTEEMAMSRKITLSLQTSLASSSRLIGGSPSRPGARRGCAARRRSRPASDATRPPPPPGHAHRRADRAEAIMLLAVAPTTRRRRRHRAAARSAPDRRSWSAGGNSSARRAPIARPRAAIRSAPAARAPARRAQAQALQHSFPPRDSARHITAASRGGMAAFMPIEALSSAAMSGLTALWPREDPRPGFRGISFMRPASFFQAAKLARIKRLF